MSALEQTVLRNIIVNDKFMRKVLPFLQTQYFQGNYRLLFKQLCKYVDRYNRLPTKEAFEIELDASGEIPSNAYDEILPILPQLFFVEPVDEEWLLEKTEAWCQERALHIAILDSITIIDGNHETLTKNAIPELLTAALGVGFDANIGHDYFDDYKSRFEYYHEDLERLPFDLEFMNKITGGGLVNKSLTIALAGTGVGKSLFMCHSAAAALTMGYDVLYITMEMSEEKIAERIDANLLDVPINKIKEVPEQMFSDKIARLKAKTVGNLIIKEYPTGQATSSHFRALLNELKLKKQFRPRIIFIDYLNICASARLKTMGGSINSYTYIKAIAEELRGLAVEFDLPIVSATQTTRSGFGNSDPGLEDTSESFGLPATADLMFALVSNEELERDGQIMVKQLKNRYNDLNHLKRFMIGVNKMHMRLYDCEDTSSIMDDSQSQEQLTKDVLGLKSLGEGITF
jgi:archaellum biogenesis ATPase FlaH